MSTPPVVHELWLARHGETEWSASGRHTSFTDVALTDRGRLQARALAPLLRTHEFARVLVSPMRRARETAELAGFPSAVVDPDLREWDYGTLEGVTTDTIRARGAAWARWTVWDGAIPEGETIDDVARRVGAVLARADAVDGDVLYFGHGHSLRVLAAIALGFEARAGARLALAPATVSVLGPEHGLRALQQWNVRP